jgi:hypothetical protein
MECRNCSFSKRYVEDSFITARVASAHVLARGLPDRGTGPDYCQRSIFRSAIFLSSVARLMPKIRAA